MNIFDKELAVALDGMGFVNEGDDQPLQPMRWPTTAVCIDEATVRAWSGEGDKPVLAIGNYEAFMEPRMQTGSQAERYQHLNALMTANLVGLTVFKFGEIQVRIYVMGLDHQGQIVGWKTTAVQT